MTRWMALVAVGATMIVACSRAAPRPAHGDAQSELASRLRAVGDAAALEPTEEVKAEGLARTYVALGPAALRVAADSILYGADRARDRGARFVLMSLERPDDFSFARDLPLEPRADAPKLACNVIDLVFLLRQSAATLPSSEPGGRLGFVPAYAKLLVHVVDRPWPVCVRSCPTCETTRHRPQMIALESLDEMRPFLDERGPVPWDGLEPEPPAFRDWWTANRGRFLSR